MRKKKRNKSIIEIFNKLLNKYIVNKIVKYEK